MGTGTYMATKCWAIIKNVITVIVMIYPMIITIIKDKKMVAVIPCIMSMPRSSNKLLGWINIYMAFTKVC